MKDANILAAMLTKHYCKFNSYQDQQYQDVICYGHNIPTPVLSSAHNDRVGLSLEEAKDFNGPMQPVLRNIL